MSTFGWLHLSDLHQGIDGQNWFWPNVREIIFEDIAKLHRLSGPWDIVFFTGDITQSGRTEEFDKSEKTLHQLFEHLMDLGSNPVFVHVPGNHDLTRPNTKKPEVKLLQRWDIETDIQREFWNDSNSPYRKIVNESFENYQTWSRSSSIPGLLKVTYGPLPGDFSATFEKDDLKIGILGVNSAFLQLTEDDFNGRLAIGLPQFHESCGGDGPKWAQSHALCFLMSHHPVDWLGENAQKIVRGEIAPPGRFAAHLFGHMHESRTETVTIGGTLPLRSWQAPALFGLEKFGSQDENRVHGYISGRINFEDGQGFIRIWPRLGVRRKAGFWSIVPEVTEFDLENDQGTRPEPINIRAKGKRKKRVTVKDSVTVIDSVSVIVKKTEDYESPTLDKHIAKRVLVLHSASDREYSIELTKHLNVLKRQRIIEQWDDLAIMPGTEWRDSIEKALSKAEILLVLISADLFASEFQIKIIKNALIRKRDGKQKVIPVVVRPCEWQTLFGNIQVLPRGGKPISTWVNSDEAWMDVANGMRSAIEYATFPKQDAISKITPKIPIKRIPIGDIFRTTGLPDITFVAPSQMQQLEAYLRVMGQGLVVEGPSGIGKTTATRKALNNVKEKWPELYISSKDSKDLEKLDGALGAGFLGHLIVDDFHHLDDDRKRVVAGKIKTIADKNRRNSKLTVIGINPVGDSLVGGFPDLVGRFVSVSLESQPRSKLDELIQKGERAANIVFLNRSDFIEAAAGSFFTLQQLCFQAALTAGVHETMEVNTEIGISPRDVMETVLKDLKFKYYKPLSIFCSSDEVSPPRGAVLALIWLLSQEKDGHVSLYDAQMQYPNLLPAFEWLRNGNLLHCLNEIPQLSSLFYYQQGAAILSAEDPQLKFYLRSMEWGAFAKKTGHRIHFNPRIGLIFDEDQ